MGSFSGWTGYSGLPKSIYVLFIVRIINAAGNFVYPFLTFFLTERVGLDAEQAGKYFLISAIAQAIGSIIGGKLTDHFGRKKLMIAFQLAAALCFLPCPFLGNSITIPILLIFSGMFLGAAQPANSAMVTDLTDRDNRKQAYSLLYMGINIGFAIGPTIAGFLYRHHTNWIFFGNVFAILISVILLYILVEETMPSCELIEESAEIADEEAAEEGSSFRALLRRPILILFVIGKLIYQFVYSSIGFAIPLQLAATFGNELGPRYFGIIMSFTGVVIILCTIPITKITNKIKAIVNVALAGFFYAAGFGMIGFIDSFWLFMLSAFTFTVGEILDATNGGVYIANNSPMNHRGRFNAIISIITGTGNAVGPYLLGKFIKAYGLKNMWILCFFLVGFAGVFMIFLSFLERRKEVDV